MGNMVVHRLLFVLGLIGINFFGDVSAEEIGPFKQLPPSYSEVSVFRIGTWKSGRYRADLDDQTLIIIRRGEVEWIQADKTATRHAIASVKVIVDSEGHWVVEAGSDKGPVRIQRFGPLWQMEFDGSTHVYMDCGQFYLDKVREAIAGDLKDMEESLNGPINPFLRPVASPP